METRLPSRKRKLREEKRPACDECRAHKLRCDAFLDYSRPCSRCVKKRVECIVLEERRKKTSPEGMQSAQSMSPEQDAIIQPRSQETLPYTNAFVTITSDSTPIRSPLALSNIQPTASLLAENVGLASTKPTFTDELDARSRTIGNVSVDNSIINICFERFNRFYVPLCPILSSEPSPTKTFKESSFKFWVIVAIGSRKCLEDPTLFWMLSPHVETLALTSLCPGQGSPYPTIEAFLLMCTWHLSNDKPFFSSVYFTISSAVVILTLQAGMHSCFSLRAVFPGQFNSSPDVVCNGRLWAYAVILNQSAMVANGYPIYDSNTSCHQSWANKCCTALPDWIVLQGRIVAIVTRAHRMVFDLQSELDFQEFSGVLKSLIANFDAELLGIDPLTKFRFAIARLQIQSLAFLSSQSDFNGHNLIKLCNAAISTMDVLNELDKTLQISLHCPEYVFQGTLLAACALLRLIKTPSMNFREQDSRKAFFSAINLLKNMSVVNNDNAAKVSEILSKLWSSPKIYRDENGGYIQHMQVGNRLTMSVLYDCLWWWRKLSADWLSEQQTQGHETTKPSEPSANQEEPNNFHQFFFDDSCGWDIDWGSLDPTHVIL
ncbi:MAG: hypothetical protein M1820_004408 [Bogoriella megaspora]|nr:MAG: hypothetical protein M1820_004408 [Bogoriella megaspora]